MADQVGTARSAATDSKPKRGRNYDYPGIEVATRLHPEFMEAVGRITALGLQFRDADSGERALPAKYAELVASALLAFKGSEQGVLNHLRRAHYLGATSREMLEAFEAAAIPGGIATFMTGANAIRALEDELERAASTETA